MTTNGFPARPARPRAGRAALLLLGFHLVVALAAVREVAATAPVHRRWLPKMPPHRHRLPEGYAPARLVLAPEYPGRALTVGPNFRISTGVTNGEILLPDEQDPNRPFNENQLGDYLGLDFYGGKFYPAWTDNSPTLPGIPDRPLPDVATAAVTVPTSGNPTVALDVNVSRKAEYQAEPAIAINPTNPQNLVVGANDLSAAAGVFQAFSTDGGASWTTRLLADGTDGLPLACCDPSIAFDSFGNCYYSYLGYNPDTDVLSVELLMSRDGGATFQHLATLDQGPSTGAAVDQPTVTTGPGPSSGTASVWLTWAKFNSDGSSRGIMAAGALVRGLGTVDAFRPAQLAPSSAGGNFGDIAVGPNGQVVVTYQTISSTTLQGPSRIVVHLDPDGLGSAGFGAGVLVTSTNVGAFDSIPPQTFRTVDAEVGLAFDRSGSSTRGRLYMVYTDEPTNESGDTDIFVRYSDDNGATWTAAQRVNDDTSGRSQFFPRIAVDSTTGRVAVIWYDARDDAGTAGANDTDRRPNTDVAVWGTVLTGTGTVGGAPAAPSNLTATAISSTQIRLRWTDNSDNEEGFKIERKIGTGIFRQISRVRANTTTFTNGGLTPGTTYTYRVRAYNASGDSPYSNEASATPSGGGTVPAAPSNLTAAAISSTQIRLTWQDNSMNEDGFRIERKTGTASFAQIAQVGANTTTFTDSGLTAGTTYTYRVRAFNAAGNSAYSNEASATPSASGAPAAPSDLTATAISATQIRLTWRDNSANESGFRVERKVGTGSFARIATLKANTTTFTNGGLTAGTTYTYRVQAYNASGASAYSNEASATPGGGGGTVPAAPSNLTAAAISSTQIRLTWQDNSTNEDGFRIERKTGTASFAQIAQVGANTTTFTDSGLTAGTTYTYRVRAFNAAGNSAYSNEASATPPASNLPAAPSNLTATALSFGQIRLTWQDNSTNEDGFRIERKTGSGSFVQIATVGPNATSFTDSGLTIGVTYTYRVRAYNASGNSAYSNEATAIARF